MNGVNCQRYADAYNRAGNNNINFRHRLVFNKKLTSNTVKKEKFLLSILRKLYKNKETENLATVKSNKNNSFIYNISNQIFGAISDFIRNYIDMRDANVINSDKYFHAKANCDAAKRGKIASLVATIICDVREITDLFRNTLFNKMRFTESLKDSKGDFAANKYGREQGRKYPKQDSRISVKKYRPNGLPEKY